MVIDVLQQEATMACPHSCIAVPIIPNDILGHSHGVSEQDAAQLSGPNATAVTSSNSSYSETAYHRALRFRLVPLTMFEADFAKQLTQPPLALGMFEEPRIDSYTARTKHFGYDSTSRDASTDGLRFEEEVGQAVEFFKEDIAALLNDKVVRELLQERKVKFELEGEFFLDNLDRLCARDYDPSDCEFKPFGAPSHYATLFFFCEILDPQSATC